MSDTQGQAEGQSTFGGLRIIESPWLTEAGEPVTVRRAWRERLFSRPWRPWRSTRIEIPQIPQRGGLIMGNAILMHPATACRLRAEVERCSIWPTR